MVQVHIAERHTHRRAPVVHLDAPFAKDQYLAYEVADSPTHAGHSTQFESMKGLSTKTRSTEAYQDLTKSKAIPKDLARKAQGFSAKGPTIVLSLAIVVAAVRATAQKQ